MIQLWLQQIKRYTKKVHFIRCISSISKKQRIGTLTFGNAYIRHRIESFWLRY